MKKYYILWPGNIYAGAIGKATIRLDSFTDDGLQLNDFTHDEEVNPPSKMVISIFEQDIEKDMPPAFVVPTLIVRNDLVEDLNQLGVKNIVCYPVTLRHGSGKQWNDYSIIKIQEFIDSVDNSKSKISKLSRGNHVLYDRMVLDESKCQEYEIFRIKTRKSLVFVSQRVVDYFKMKGYPHLNFVLPEDFA
jgi:hypothetical protein